VAKFTACTSTSVLLLLLLTGVAAKTCTAQSLLSGTTQLTRTFGDDPGGGDPEPSPGPTVTALTAHTLGDDPGGGDPEPSPGPTVTALTAHTLGDDPGGGDPEPSPGPTVAVSMLRMQ
jgi:hypothetical protein